MKKKLVYRTKELEKIPFILREKTPLYDEKIAMLDELYAWKEKKVGGWFAIRFEKPKIAFKFHAFFRNCREVSLIFLIRKRAKSVYFKLKEGEERND